MQYIKRNNLKVRGFKKILNSIKYSVDGLNYAYRYEQSLWIHAVFTILAISLGIIFRIKLSEWAIVFVALGVILGMELINTAIEATVDLVTLEINPLAKIAKDTSSAATFVISFVALIIALFVFGPYFMALF